MTVAASLRGIGRGWPWLAGGLLVLVLLVVALRPRAIEVEVTLVSRGAMRVTLDEEGRTRVRDTFLLTTPVTGTVSRITLEPGDRVTQGQLIATVQPASPPLLDARSRTELRARVEAARATLGQAEAEQERSATALAQAQADLRRLRALEAAGAVASADLEAAERRATAAGEAQRAAQFAASVATHQVDAARAALAQGSGQPGGSAGAVRLEAPVDGVVLRRARVSAGVVPPGEPILEIGDPRRLEVVADFLSTDAVRIAVGAPVSIEQWGGEEAIDGRVRRIEPAGFTRVSALGVEEQRVNVIIDVIDAGDALDVLGDGYRVEVRAVIWEAPDVLLVPLGSLFRDGDAWGVFVVDGDRASRRVVAIGQRSDRHAVVMDGLQDGDRVVVHPGDTLADGARIVARPL
jgi:HlyD family secretion protein